VLQHLSEQGLFGSVIRVRFGQNKAKANRDAIDIPGDDQQHKANAEKPGVLLAFATFLGGGIFGASFGDMAAITNREENAVFRWRSGRDDITRQPCDQGMDTPVIQLEQPSQAPCPDGLGAPASDFLQGFTAWIEGLHDHDPAQHKPMLAFPHAWPISKHDGDEGRQVSQNDHDESPNQEG
jgi:hypothetical protein